MSGENRREQREKLANSLQSATDMVWPFRIVQSEAKEAEQLRPHISQSLAVDVTLECEYNFVPGSP